MPVFDFNNTPDKDKPLTCTYTTFRSDESTATPERPMLVLDNKKRQWKHHSSGFFSNPAKQTTFEFEEEDGIVSADILQIDARFVSLLKWLGGNHIHIRLSGENRENGYAVYKIREIAFGGGTKLSAEDGFLQFMIERLLASNAPEEIEEDEDAEEVGDDMKLTSIQSITDFMTCAGKTLPDNIRLWARRNLAVAKSHEVSPEERRHAQRALSIMMNVQWKSNYFESIDPQEARRILDEELYGYLTGIRSASGRTCRNRKIPDCLCGCTNPETAVDNSGYEFHQRSGTADRKLPCLCQCKTGYHYGCICNGRRVQSGIYY